MGRHDGERRETTAERSLRPVNGRRAPVAPPIGTSFATQECPHAATKPGILEQYEGGAVKGIMFSEFVEWVERTWTPDTADQMLDATELASMGAYTGVGTYDHREMLALVTTLARLTEQPASDLVRGFGRDLFPRLAQGHPDTLAHADDAFALLNRLEAHIHPEVRKLYPGAEVPSFSARSDDRSMQLTYRSPRHLADLAEGLIEGCAAWFDEALTIRRQEQDDGSTCFHIERPRGG